MYHADHICNVYLYWFFYLSASVIVADVQNYINSCSLSFFVSCSSLILVWRRSIETTAPGSTYPTEKTRTWLAQLATPPSMHIWGSSRGTYSWSSETSERNADTFIYHDWTGSSEIICLKKASKNDSQSKLSQKHSCDSRRVWVYFMKMYYFLYSHFIAVTN